MRMFKDEYGAELGILVTCQHCGKQTFRRKISIAEFEPISRGWKINRISPHYGWWCPNCIKEYTI
jgi:hypothetical protein